MVKSFDEFGEVLLRSGFSMGERMGTIAVDKKAQYAIIMESQEGVIGTLCV